MPPPSFVLDVPHQTRNGGKSPGDDDDDYIESTLYTKVECVNAGSILRTTPLQRATITTRSSDDE
jgi:hypothetical protein